MLREQLNYPENSNIPFIPLDEELEYCEEHGFEVIRLENGMQIISAAKGDNDAFQANIGLLFPTGAAHDPDRKAGLHHLMEHLVIGDNLDPVARENDVDVNGSTSPDSLEFTLGGVANPHVKEYGIWNCLPEFYQMLAEPLTNLRNREDLITQEKGVVYREIIQRQSVENYEQDQFLSHTLYATDNPMLTNIPGSLTDLESIILSDLQYLAMQVLVPDKSLLVVTTEGTKTVSQALSHELMLMMESFPRADRKSHPVDKSTYGHLNPNLIDGSVFIRENINASKLRFTHFVWVMEHHPYSLQDLALSRVIPHIYHHLHDHARNSGLSYSVNVDVATRNDKKLIFIGLPLSPEYVSVEYLSSKILPDIKKLLLDISYEELIKSNERERLIHRAIPMNSYDRFKMLKDGLSNHGRIIDADMVKSKYLEIKPDHLLSWLEKLASRNPAIIVT